VSEAYIVAFGRSAGAKRRGRLASLHPVDLAAQVLDGLVERSRMDPALIEDVIMGCVGQGGEQSQNVARNAVLASRRLPESVPGVTVDRQCGSSQQALHFAAALVKSGIHDVVIAAGVEHMTRVPMFSPSLLAEKAGMGAYHEAVGIRKHYPNIVFSQFTGAESVARKYHLSREAMEQFAIGSHKKAAAAAVAGEFDSEIIPVVVEAVDGSQYIHSTDEGVRPDASLEALAALKPITPEGLLTAGTASQICDGASAALIMNEQGLKRTGAEPIARLHHVSVFGHDPVIMLEAPIPATASALKKCGMAIADIDAYEINEAFASIPMAWLQASGADPERLNRRGGAIALGHPLGATGTKLLSTLVSTLQSRMERWGLQVMCEGGGVANVTIVELLRP
jgi:acetyl-CoA C-acetyltransferase